MYGHVAPIETGGPVFDGGRVVGQLGRRRKDVNAVSRRNAEVQDMLKQDVVAWEQKRVVPLAGSSEEDAMQEVKVVSCKVVEHDGWSCINYMMVCHPFSFMMSIQKTSLPSSDCRHVSLIKVIN